MEKLKIFCQEATGIQQYVCCIEELAMTEKQFKID